MAGSNDNELCLIPTGKFSTIAVGVGARNPVVGVASSPSMGDNSNNKNNSELERRIVALETGSQYEANQSAVEQVRMECLQTLKQIRTALVMDQQQQQSNGMGVVASSLSTLNEQVLQQQQWEDEKTILQAKVSKLEYRIHHMVNSMETLYVKSK